MTRLTVIQEFITKRKYKRYLELGLGDAEHFNAVQCDYKACVDIGFTPTYKMSTDEFFEQNTETFDLIFIDACHEEMQVQRDIYNSLACLNPKGVIVLHDCLPESVEEELVAVGTSWKAFSRYRLVSPYLTYCHNFDHGVGVIDTAKSKGKVEQIPALNYDHLIFEELMKFKKKLLGLRK